MVYICPRTGRSYATPEMALQIEGSCEAPAALAIGTAIPIPVSASSPGGIDYRQRDIYGNLTTNQKDSSQYWMDAGYTGAEPDLATKAYYSDAQFAYDNAVRIAQRAVQTQQMVNPAIVALSEGATEQTGFGAPGTNYALENMLNGVSGSFSRVISWLMQNWLMIVIIIGAVFILPRVLSSAIPSGRGRRSL